MRRAEGRLRDRDARLVVELGALAPERGMRRDMDGHVQRAGRAAPRPDLALVGEPDLVALVDAGAGCVTRSVRLRSARPVAVAGRTGVSTILPSPRQRGHALTLTIWPSIVWRTLRTSPRPVALRAGRRLRARLGARASSTSRTARATRNSISFSVPLTASSNVIRRS